MGGLGERMRQSETTALRAVHALRRAWLLGGLRARAAWRRTTLDLDVASDLRVGRRVRVQVAPRSHLRIHIAPRCRIGDDVLLFLTAGAIEWGEDVQLRVRSSLNLTGTFRCDGDNIISYGTVIHCLESIRFRRWATCAEYVTIADSAHYYSAPDVAVSENTVSAPIDLGVNTFLGPRTSINRGVTVGDYSIVGPNSVITRDLPAGSFASGVPATIVRELDLPWERTPRPTP
jgi:acetyltransferase-like isoleucine patch superfamily enzyme